MSSSRASLRRSRRAPKKNGSEYAVGDLVEINRNNTLLTARLAQPLTEGSSVHPRWLVKFEGPYKDEEVYEHTFAKVFPAGTSTRSASDESLRSGGSKKGSAKDATAVDSSVMGTDVSVNLSINSSNDPGKKNVGLLQETASNLSDDSSPPEVDGAHMSAAKKRKASAREQRSKRRQAMIDEFGADVVSPPSRPQNGSGKRKHVGNGKLSKSKRFRDDKHEKCLKVKLLTGTLYIYRGKHRRAEFVRRV